MAVAMAALCLGLIVLVAGFARELHMANQRPVAGAPAPSEETLLLRSLLAAQKAAASSPKASVPGGGTGKEAAQLVIETSRIDPRRRDLDDRTIWPFSCLIPAGHLAQFVFIAWSNGVPTINPDDSGYLKVGEKPVVLKDLWYIYDTNRFRPPGATDVAHWSVVFKAPDFETGHFVTNQPPFRKLETASKSILHSGHQLAIRLAEFVPPAGSASHGWSGVEIRLFLQPLTSPAVRTDPNEFDYTNYVADWGLAGMSKTSVLKLIKELPIEPQPVEESP
jgi:hypothetical protein